EALPERHVRNPLVAADHGPQADCAVVSRIGDVLFLHWRLFRDDDPPAPDDTEWICAHAGPVQPDVHNARRGDDFLFPDPFDPGSDWEFLYSADDRSEGSGVSEDQPAELVHLHRWRPVHDVVHDQRRPGHGLDVLHAVEHGLFEFGGGAGGGGHLYHRIF